MLDCYRLNVAWDIVDFCFCFLKINMGQTIVARYWLEFSGDIGLRLHRIEISLYCLEIEFDYFGYWC